MSVKVSYFPCIFEERCYEFKTRNKSLATVLLSLIRKYPEIREDSGNISIRVNGKLVSPFKWHCTSLKDEDHVFIIQEIGVIDWILEALASIGIISATSTGLGATAATIGIGFGGAMMSLSTLSTILTVALTVASLAFSIVQMCNKPDAKKAPLANTPTYGWDGIVSNMQQGGPIPCIYGEHLTGGTLVGCYVSTDGDKNFLNMLLALSEGEIEGIMKEDLSGVCTDPTIDAPYIKIDDNFLSNYGIGNYWWDYRLGVQEQPIIPGWNDIKLIYSPGSPELTMGGTYIYTTVDNDVESYELGVRYVGMQTNYKNTLYPVTINLNIYYRIHDGTPPNEATNWTFDGTFSTFASTTAAVRRRWRKEGLAANQYDIKIAYAGGLLVFGQSFAYLDNVTEIKYDDVSYPYTALLAIKFLATEKMSGQTPNTVTRIRGIKIKNLETDVIEYTPNPVYAVNDMIINERYGLGRFVSPTNVDEEQLIEEAQHCFEMVGDGTKRDVAESGITGTTLIAATYGFLSGDVGKTICVKSPLDATEYTNLIITSVGGTGNHVATGTAGWDNGTPTDTEWEFGEHRFELDIVLDTQDNAIAQIQMMCASWRCAPLWTQNVIQLILDRKKTPSYLFNMGNIIANSFQHTFGSEKSKPTVIEVDFANRDNYYQREVREVDDNEAYLLNNPRRIRKLSQIGCTRPSQLFRNGRYHLRAANLQDQSITFSGMIEAIHNLPGDCIKFQHDVNSWGKGGRIMAATINSLTADQEIKIEYGKTYVVTVRQPGATAGSEILETRAVYNIASVDVETVYTNVLTVSSNFSAIPVVFSLYAFGESSVEAVPFSITKLARTKENQIQVEANLYDANVYADTDIVLPSPIYSQLPNPLKVLPVTNLTLYEGGIVLDDGTWVPYIEVGFIKPDDALTIGWSHVNVYISVSQDNFVTETKQFYGTTMEQNGYQITGSPYLVVGQVVRVRLVSVNKAQKEGDWSTSPYEDIIIVGKTTAPSDVTTFLIQQMTSYLLFTWDAPLEKDTAYYEIREGPAWDVGQKIATQVFGTSFSLFDYSGGLKNYLIKAFDRTGNESINPAQFQIITASSQLEFVATTADGLNNPKIFPDNPTFNSLLHFDGANNSTTIVDEYGHTWYANGNAKLSTSGPVFGSAKLVLGGGSDFVFTETITSLGFPFTLEGRFYLDDKTTTWQTVVAAMTGGGLEVMALIYNPSGDSKFKLYLGTSGNNFDIANGVAGSRTSWTNGTWVKWVLNFDGAVYRVFFDSVIDIAVTNANLIGGFSYFILGTYTSGSYPFVGGMDEFRGTFGNARYGNNTEIETVVFAVGTVIQGANEAISLAPTQGWDDGHTWDEASDYWDIPIDALGYFETQVIDAGSVANWLIIITDDYTVEGTGQTATIEIKTSNDNVTWSAYSTFVAGEHDGRYYQFKMILGTDDTTKNINVITFTIQIGLSKTITMRMANKTVAAGGTTFTYGYAFASNPAVQVSVISATALIPVVTAISTTQCTVKVFNTAGSDVGGQVNLTIEGY